MTVKEGISVIIPVTERVDSIENLLMTYQQVIASTGRDFEIICVLDGKFAHLKTNIRQESNKHGTIRVISLSRNYGESVALAIAIEHARYDLVLTLPSYEQIESNAIPTLFDHIDEADVVVARRWPRKDSAINRFTNRVFHAALRWITQVPFRDIGCGVRVFKRRVFSEITIYGDQHRFLPVLADRRGFKVVEIDLPQAESDLGVRIYSPRVYVSRLLDLIGVFFLARFTKKPLRFFGMIGSVLGLTGIIILFVAVLQRYAFDMALADRPILLLGSLCLVLGAQLFALGLVGELIIFTHARDLKEYVIAETVNISEDE
ncbi:MAG: glycosyltransferase [Proteobacteria bacterium]|nr:glycosyltransferase [Pseudomonadota bacterium]